MGKIAIITPCYNAPPELVFQHFLTVDQQRSENIVHIIVDDASTREDTKLALVTCANVRYKNTVLIKSDENKGPGAARNRAVDMIAKMKDIDYVCLLDIDDYFEKDSVKLRRLVLEDDKDLIAVYGDKYLAKYELVQYNATEVLDETKKTLENVSPFNKPRLFNECYIPSCSVMFRWKPFYEHVRYFREDVRLCEDWLVWRKLSLLGAFKKINVPIYTQTMHGDNLTTNPDVLRNHRQDMITTRIDLDEWIAAKMPTGVLKP
jgi:glycosyltransferase involved in cell wall biosynthesis